MARCGVINSAPQEWAKPRVQDSAPSLRRDLFERPCCDVVGNFDDQHARVPVEPSIGFELSEEFLEAFLFTRHQPDRRKDADAATAMSTEVKTRFCGACSALAC